MSKRRMIEHLTALWCRQQAQLDAYRLQAGPTSWGICPTDPRAASMLGRIEGLQQACREIKGMR